MSDPNTARVLGLPGGGTRGYMQNYAIDLFCNQAGIDGDKIWRYFDVIGGTSVGGLNALAYAYGLSPTEIYNFYIEHSPWIFTIRTALDLASGSINASLPSNRPDKAQKVIILGQNEQFYSSVDPVNSNYGSARLKSALIGLFGTATLQDLKTNVVIPSYRDDTNSYILFSNLDYPNLTGQNELIVNVALATSAAHFYLPPVQFGGHTYLDGGVFQNNPTRLALSCAKQFKPISNRYCVFTPGTGLSPESGFDGPNGNLPYEGAINTLKKAFDASLTGCAESVHIGLSIESQYSINNLFYYMTRPSLSADQNTELDNTDPDYFQYLVDLTTQWFNDDASNISNFIGHFNA